MNCREFVDFLMAWLDEELPAEQRSVFEDHIRACPPCNVYLEQYKQTVELGRCVCRAEDEAPPDAPEELIRAILAARRRG
jgi:anti-sigma factor RsiW